MPSPQRAWWQLLVHPSVSTLFPSSHSSAWRSTKLSPQVLNAQLLRQASSFTVFWSSHCSKPFTIPSPQNSAPPLLLPDDDDDDGDDDADADAADDDDESVDAAELADA